MKLKFQLFAILITLRLECCSCGSTKMVIQTVRDVSVDTVYLKDVSVEYRCYKLLRDTVRIVQRDSIPYEVIVTEIKELTRPLSWFDHLSRTCFGICFGGFLITILYLINGIRTKL